MQRTIEPVHGKVFKGLTIRGVQGGQDACIPCVLAYVFYVTVVCVVRFLQSYPALRGTIPRTTRIEVVMKANRIIIKVFYIVFLVCDGDFLVGRERGRVKLCGVLKLRGNRVKGIVFLRADVASLLSLATKVKVNVLKDGLSLLLLFHFLRIPTILKFCISVAKVLFYVTKFKKVFLIVLTLGLAEMEVGGPVRLLENKGAKRGRPQTG